MKADGGNAAAGGSRRQSLKLLVGAAFTPGLALGRSHMAFAADTPFDPPAAPMRLTRRLIRGLPDGSEIQVERSWDIVFARTAGGFMVSGQQTSVTVETPPSLEFLAELERNRLETGLLPMALGPDGMIAGGEPETSSAFYDRAVAQAAARINRSGFSGDAAHRVRDALSALQKSLAEWGGKVPRDLFRPQQLHWQVLRGVDLPGGPGDNLAGQIAVTFDARMDAAGQLMEQRERRVVSTLGGSSQTSSEEWWLAPI